MAKTLKKNIPPTLTENFQRYFSVDLATTQEQKNAVYHIRYRVYCDEFHYEPADRFPDEREFDVYDDNSLHCLITHRSCKARHSPMLIAFSEVGRQAIYADPAWNGGDYYAQAQKPDAGLAVARMVGHITYLSEQAMHSKFGRRLQSLERYGYEFQTEFAVESYLKYNGNNFTRRFDANSYLYVTKALDYFDLSAPTGSLTAAFASSTHVKYLVVSFTSDWLYPTYHSKELVAALTAVDADVTYLDIQSTWGHDAFLLEVDTMTRLLESFLQRLAREEEVSLPDANLRKKGEQHV